jgi:predicted DCC family thiol-disulfide oxidoreductase YuxK
MTRGNGWTGGQYSLFRILFGIYLLVNFLRLLVGGTAVFSGAEVSLPERFPSVLALSDSPALMAAVALAGIALSVLFTVGCWDRAAAVPLAYLWVCLHGLNPLLNWDRPSFLGWLLLAQTCLPPAPYGSWSARGRLDPGGGWHLPGSIFLMGWLVLAIGYLSTGFTRLSSLSWEYGTALREFLGSSFARATPLRTALLAAPDWLLQGLTWVWLGLELAFAPLALMPRVRPWIWSALVALQLCLLLLLQAGDLTCAMLLLHLFTFDPAWVRPLPGPPEVIFYDGHCGLCHRGVRWILAEDPTGLTFRFAPLQGELFEKSVSPEVRATLPDSLIVRTADGALLSRAAAVRQILLRLGGLWRVIGAASRAVPLRLLDAVYDGIARTRYHLFRRPDAACPLLPPELRSRFDL